MMTMVCILDLGIIGMDVIKSWASQAWSSTLNFLSLQIIYH